MNHPLRNRFLQFGESECVDSSELYHHLSLAIAEDEELLSLAELSGNGQPIPNLFFGAIHYLLATLPGESLTRFYPSLATNAAGGPKDAFPAFRSFALSQREAIAELLTTRLVQTNEVRRCAYLFPSMMYAARWFKGRPLALIEIGTSAGLNLLWDKYSYRYGDRERLGAPDSPVLICSDFRGELSDSLNDPLPEISHRIGLDLNIVDARVPDEAAWLQALIWPEHHQRRAILAAALQHMTAFQLDLREGDGFSNLTELAGELTKESVTCIYHTHVANQVSKQIQKTFLSELAELGRDRDLIHLFNNIDPSLYLPDHSPNSSGFNLHLTVYRDGIANEIPLATTDGHARWFDWLPTDTTGKHDGADRPLPS